MINLTVNSQTVTLLHFAPNWAAPVEAEFRILSDSERGLTGREERTPLSTSLRTSLSFELLLNRTSAAELRAALKALGNTPVLCPFWPGAGGYYDDKTFYAFGSDPFVDSAGEFYVSGETGDTKTARLSSGVMLVYEPDWSAYEVYNAALSPSFEPSISAVKVPLLWGQFSKAPKPEMITDELMSVRVQFVENSPIENAFTAAALNFAAGPQAAGQVRPLFPQRPNWNTLDFGEALVELDSEEIGYGRETSDTYYPQTAARVTEQEFLCSSWAQIHALIRFFSDSLGPVKNFWLPAFVGDCRLTASVLSGAGTLQTDNAAGLGASSHLALISPSTVEPHTIAALDTAADTVELGEVTVAAFDPNRTLVSPLLLARFASASLKIRFETDAVARTALRFREVPEELEEDLSDESGAQDATAFLYRFELAGFDDWLFTSHEAAITHGADVYTPRRFDHSDAAENLNLEKNNITLTSRYFWHDTDPALRNPLGYFLPFRLEAPLYVSILECSPDAAGDIASAKTIFSGQVKSANFDGPRISAKCVSLGSIFDRQIPTLLIQPTCNFPVFGTSCGLSSNDWKMSATVVSYDGAHELIIGQPAFVDAGATRPAVSVFEHFFAGGKLEAGANQSFERRSVLDSVANGGNIKLSIRHPLENIPESIFLWAGCDGRKETCSVYHAADNPDGKFDNFARFGGFPFVPSGNPTLAKINRDYSNNGKK